MANKITQFESSDNSGRTEAFSGTATTSVANVPAISGQIISGAIITAKDNNFEISFDNGTSYFPLNKDDVLSLNIKGNITQLKIKTSSGTSDYRMIVYFEED